MDAAGCVRFVRLGGARRFDARLDENVGDVGETMVVLLPGNVASSLSDGGGGRSISRLEVGRTDAFQRKHSPVPK